MALLLDLVRVLLSFSWMSFQDSLVTLLGLGVLYLLALFLFGIALLGVLAGCRPGVLRVSGHVARLVAIYCEATGDGGNEVPSSGFRPISGSGPGRKRIRVNRKTPGHLVGSLMHSRPRVWKRLRHEGFVDIAMPDHARRRCDQAYEGSNPAQNRVGVG